MINYLFIVLFISPFVGSGMHSLIKYAKIDTLLGILISFIIGFIFLIILNYISKNKNKTFVNTVNSIFKKPFNYIILILLFIYILFNCINKVYGINDYISSQFLVKTPVLIIGIPFTLLNIYINFKGFITIKKLSKIVFYINIILMLLAVVGLIPDTTISNLKPMFTNDYLSTIKGGLYINCICLIPTFISIDYNKKLLPAYIISYLVIFMMTFTIYGVMGLYLVQSFQHPGYIAFQYFNFLNFINRVENILNIQWILGLFLSMSAFSYYLCSHFKSKIFKIIIPILCLVLSLLYSSKIVFNNILLTYLPYISIIVFIILLIIFVKIKIDHKRSILDI